MFGRKKKDVGPKFPPPIDYVPPQKSVRPSEVTIVIDERQIHVPSDWTILKAARENGVRIPSLCHHPRLPATGRCGVCVVAVEGHTPPLVKACKTLVQEGMIISTNCPEVVHQSLVNLREFLGSRSLEQLVDHGTREIEDLVRFARDGAIEAPAAAEKAGRRQQYAIVRDQSLCIACTRCVRACSGVQAMNVLLIDPDRPLQPISFEGDKPLQSTSCIACGQCTAVCPTGAVRERSDADALIAELGAPAESRKILVLATAPSARLSVGEMMGEEPGQTVVGKLIAAAHSIGFNFVFDVTFTADTTAALEAEELVERIQRGGPFPMFTSCCPGWVNLVEKKYPHLRQLLSRCKSPLGMLGAMVRDWFEKKGIDRSKYLFAAVMPCVAKKEEVARPELLDSKGRRDIDVALTSRELARLFASRKVDWAALPGEHKATYDEPFCNSSGAAALFGVSGGVTEAALRVAHTILTQKTPSDRGVYEACRRVVRTGEYIDAQVDVTRGGGKLLDSAIVSGARAIQQFLREVGIEDTLDGFTRKGSRLFVEMMACPGGCVGGGGQPFSADDHILEKRRKCVYRIDESSRWVTPTEAQGDFMKTFLEGLTSQRARQLLEYDPPQLGAKGRPGAMPMSGMLKASDLRESGPIRTTVSSATGSAIAPTAAGRIAVLYGSQGGVTQSYARRLQSFLLQELSEAVLVQAMDRFPFQQLQAVETLVVMTSTWESEDGRLMPANARDFWDKLCAQPHSALGSLLAQTKLAVLGFGSTKHPKFCTFAVDLNGLLLRFGAHPFVELTLIDVERADHGNKKFGSWCKAVSGSLLSPGLPSPSLLVVPSVSAGSARDSARSVALPPGFHVATVTRTAEYKDIPADSGSFHYVELDTGKLFLHLQPDQFVHVMPRNSKSDVESLLNLIYPGLINTPITLVPVRRGDELKLPAHLTVRSLFEQFVDLSRAPSRWFVQQLESLVDETQSTMRPIADDKDLFAAWSRGKSYFTVLRQYQSVMPSIEVLVSMLPLMQPRPYAMLHVEPQQPHTIGLCVKRIAGGLCSNFLTGAKKGDTVLVSFGPSNLSPANILFSQAASLAATGSPPLHATSPAATQQQQRSPTLRPSPSNTSVAKGDAVPVAGASEAATARQGPQSVPLERFPLSISVKCLFGSMSHQITVDEPAAETFEISNTGNCKYRFTLEPASNEKWTVSVLPAAGIIKKQHVVTVKATLLAHCTQTVRASVKLSCESLGKGESAVASTLLPIEAETKLSVKLDADELKLDTLIGEGGFGQVWKGEWRAQVVAIKVMKDGKGKVADFLAECQLLKEIRCQYVVNFVGYTQKPSRYCLLTEYMPLGSLAKYIHAADLIKEYRMKAWHDVARGLMFLHSSGVIHRDVKPENVLVVSLDYKCPVICKLTDFGLARPLASFPRRPPNESQEVAGTPAFMAPEVIKGEEHTMPADVYSFAVLGFELLAGREAFPRKDFAAPWQVAQFVTDGKRPAIPDSLPSAVTSIISSAWAQDPVDRPRLGSIVDDITGLISFLGLLEASDPSVGFMPQPIAAKPAAAAAAAAAAGPHKKHDEVKDHRNPKQPKFPTAQQGTSFPQLKAKGSADSNGSGHSGKKRK